MDLTSAHIRQCFCRHRQQRLAATMRQPMKTTRMTMEVVCRLVRGGATPCSESLLLPVSESSRGGLRKKRVYHQARESRTVVSIEIKPQTLQLLCDRHTKNEKLIKKQIKLHTNYPKSKIFCCKTSANKFNHKIRLYRIGQSSCRTQLSHVSIQHKCKLSSRIDRRH